MQLIGRQVDHDIAFILNIPTGQYPRIFERAKTIHISIRRLARDINNFLVWFNSYGSNRMKWEK